MANKKILMLFCLFVATLLITASLTSLQSEQTMNHSESIEEYEYTIIRTNDEEKIEGLGYSVVETYESFTLAKKSVEDNPQFLNVNDIEVLENENNLSKIHLRAGTINVDDISSSEENIFSDQETYHLVKAIGPIKQEWKNTIEDYGNIVDYVPENTFVVKATQSDANSLSNEYFINRVGDYKPEYKISPELKDASDKTEVTINTYENTGDLLSQILPYGNLIKHDEDTIQLETYGSYVDDLANIDGISFIEPKSNLKLLNADGQWIVQTGTSDDRSIWDNGLKGDGQVVGVSDTGLDYDHAAFRDPDGNSIGDNHRKVVNYVEYANDNDNAESGHGTHVSGSIAGNDDVNGDPSTNDGMAKNAKLSFYDIGDSSDNLDIPSDYSEIFQPAYDDGARLHSNSWGGQDSSYTTDASDVDEFMWNNKDMLILYANGNSGDSPSTVGTPATAKNIVSVGASSGSSSSIDDMADFSSRGPTDDGRIKPTIVAPGTEIMSADSDGDLSTNNEGYTSMQGTSMATPITAGSSALIREYFEDGHYPEGTISNPSAALIKSVLVNGAVEISGSGAYANEDTYPNNDQGWGRINLENSLEFDGDTRNLKVYDETEGINTGTTESYNINVEDTSEPLEITMAYTDYPGSSTADKALVNDLNLKVTAPDGSEYRGNVFSGYNPGESTTGGDYDDLNPLESVLRLNPQSGEYTIEVTGENIPEGPQPFAIAVTGEFGSGPNADFDYSPEMPVEGDTVEFTDQSSEDIEEWSWDFGDGETSTDQNPTHVYDSADTYTVELTVTDVEGETDSTQKDISVSDGSPNADFDFEPEVPVEGETVQFTDESTDPDGSVEEWSWDFGDGTTSNEQNPTHSYDNSGTYTVELIVTDDDGKTDSINTEMTVEEPSYCEVEGGDTSYNEYITNVQFNGIDKDSEDDGGYADHTDSVSNDVEPGKTYELSVTMSTGGYSDYISVVIDWNQDYDLSDNEVIEVGYGNSDPQTVTTEITVPEDVSEGDTRMRIMQNYEEYHTNPCSDQDYGETEDYTVSIDTNKNQPPTADFSYSPTEPEIDETVQFTDESTDDDGSVDEWSWNFGDGTTSDEENPTHAYSSEGTYSVELTVTDDEGATDSTTEEISVSETPNEPPTADFSFSPTEPEIDETVQFTDESTDEDGSVDEWSWNFGDGETSTEENPTHAYSSEGTYSVELTVTDDEGATDSTTEEISVSETPNEPPTADFSFSPTEPEIDETVQFTDESNDPDGSIEELSWDFGDGETSTEENPTHAYSSEGTYSVELTVTDDEGATDTTTQDITVDKQYCEVEGGDTSYNEYITNVQFNGIDKDSEDDGGYADHTDSVSNDVEPGKTYELSVTMSTGGYSDYISVVIDWNQDYDLSDNEVIEVGYGNSDPQTVTTEITVPEDVSEGDTRMRIMQEYDGYHTDPCSDQDYGETEDYTVSIDTIENQPPTADFSYSPTEPEIDETVQFTDESTDPDGSIEEWSWDFGDGDTSNEENPTHAYSSEGTYSVELTVTDDEGATDSTTEEISVSETPNEPPTADFSFSPTEPEIDETVQFTDESNDPDGSIEEWSWDFGDGDTSNEENPTHAYSSEGTYSVELTVTDDEGATDTTTQDITVESSGGEMTDIINQDFEGNTSDWTASGLWHLVDDSNTYGDSHSPSTSVWYGQDSTGDYDTGSQTTGSIGVPTIDLSGATQAELSFYHWFETESYSGSYDQIEVTVNGDQVYYKDSSDDNVGSEGNFVEETIDISEYAGETIDIEFTFDSVDGSYNSYRGWYVDDVVVQADAGSVVTTNSNEESLDTNPNDVTGAVNTEMNLEEDITTSHFERPCREIVSPTNKIKFL